MNEWFEGFKDKLNEIGIGNGDLLYISSDITRFTFEGMKKCHYRKADDRNWYLHQLVETLQILVGTAGTIMIPVFTWEFCVKSNYDIKTTPGAVGALGNWILQNRSEFVRTKHPIYSFLVWGKDSEILCRMDNRIAWGKDSPFAYLYHNNGKNLLLDVSLEDSFTFVHYVENEIKVPFRYMKDFTGSYIDVEGTKTERTYSMFVRDLGITSRQKTPDDCLDKVGVAKAINYYHSILRVVDLNKAFKIIKNNFLFHNADQWYVFDQYQINWKEGQTHEDETNISW